MQKTPVATFDAILVRGTLPDRYRPTLYDFITHEALRFYSAGEQAGAQPQDAFEVSADSPIFDAPQAFVAWSPAAGVPQATNLVTAPLLRAVRLYQDLLKFHRPDSDPTAFVDADLARLVFGHNIAVGESKNSRYRAALKRFGDQWADHEVAAMALYHSATLLQSETNLVEARALALRGKETHPSSPGGKVCHNLIQQIEKS